MPTPESYRAKSAIDAVAAAVAARPVYTTNGSGASADRLLTDIVELSLGGPSQTTALPRMGCFGQITGTNTWKPPMVSTGGHLIVQRAPGQLPSSSAIFSATTVANGATGNSLSIDTAYATGPISIFGEVSQSGNLTLCVEYSADNSTYYKDPNAILIELDGSFARTFTTGARYVRLRLENNEFSSIDITAIASYKLETAP